MLMYDAKDLIFIGYTDSVFQTDIDSKKSTSGFIFALTGGAIIWRSIKQGCIVQPNCEQCYNYYEFKYEDKVYEVLGLH